MPVETIDVNPEQVVLIEDRKVWGACEHCGQVIRTPLPITPVFFLQDVTKLIPMSRETLHRKLFEFDKAGLLGVSLYVKTSGLAPPRRVLRSYEIQLLRNYFLRTINPKYDKNAGAKDKAKKYIRVAELFAHDVRVLFDDPPLRWKREIDAERRELDAQAATTSSPETTGGLVPSSFTNGRPSALSVGKDDEGITPDIRKKLDRNKANKKRAGGG